MIYVIAGLYFSSTYYGFSRKDAEDLESLSWAEFLSVMALFPWVLLGNVVLEIFGITFE